MLRGYLRGETVPAGDWDSRIEWLDGVDYEPVPLEIMCSGPKAIAVAASVADRVTLTVGAAPERVGWALDVLDEGLAAAGRSRDQVEVGAYVGVTVEDDPALAIEQLRIRVKGIAHMAALPGIDLERQPEALRAVTTRLRTAYDYRHHNVEADNPLGQLIEPEFARWFGIGGPPGYVAERLHGLAQAGLSYVFVAGMSGAERERFAAEVMPQLTGSALG
jgi:5,10-methylenetetrahydromethanopterin reductase